MREPDGLTSTERWLVLNLYGTLLIGGGVVVATAAIVLAGRLPLGVTVAVLVLALASAGWGLRISARLPTKVRVFRTTMRRIARHGFQERYFETLCGEPCMRQVTRLVLRRTGHAHLRAAITARYRGNATFHIEHSNPAIDDLIHRGALSEHAIRDAVAAALRQSESPDR